MRIEIVGVEPPCKKCKALMENAMAAVKESGIDAEVIKLDVLSDEAIERYGIVMTPALAIDGFIVSQGKVLSTKQILRIIRGMK